MKKRIFYGFGSLSYSVISQTISSFFMFFSTSVLGISGGLIGLAIAISTVWDGVSDTFIGYLSDKRKIGKMGNRNGYMLIACIGMTIFNLFLWSTPITFSTPLKFTWILLSLIILETFNTMFATPYSALGNELASSYTDRTKINATSTVFNLIGIIIPSILLVIFLPNTADYPIGQLNPHGYVKISIVTSSICLFFGIICSLTTIPKNKWNKVTNTKFHIKDLFKNSFSAFKNKKLKLIIIGYTLTSIATVFLCSVGLHFFTYSFFYTSTQITFLLLSLMLGTIISQPLWVYVSSKKKKKPALILGIIVTILSVFGVIFVYLFRIQIYNISYYLMLIFIFLCGIGSGALYSLPASMYGDEITKISSNDGNNMVATYTGSMTLAGNIASSITQLIVGILLDVIHFDSSIQVQSLGVQTGLALILFIGVQASLIIACSVFSNYKEKN